MNKFYTSRLTLETHDAASGKLCQRVEGHNFIGQPTIRYMKWVQRCLYRQNMASLGGTDTDATVPPDPINCVYLTNAQMAEDPNNEYSFPGNLVGWATQDATYAGADTLRGTPNTTQLYADGSSTKWVFDWPTNAANGTIYSVGFGRFVVGDSVGGTPNRTLVQQGGSIEQIWSTPSLWNYFARASSTQAFAQTSGTNINVLDGNYTQTATFSVAAQFGTITGLAWDRTNNFLWIIGTSGANKVIAAYNASGVLQTGPFTLTNRNYAYLAHDGSNLWSAVTTTGTSTVTFFRLKTTDGSDMTNFTTTLPDTDSYFKISGLAWDPTYQRLWTKFSTRTYQFTDSTANYNYNRAFMRAHDTNGQIQTVDVSLNPADLTGTGITFLYNTSINNATIFLQDFDIIDGYQFAMPTNWGNVNRVARFRPDGLGTRALLGTPVVKDNTQTLKLIYTINYV
jgi:hypothetical protein